MRDEARLHGTRTPKATLSTIGYRLSAISYRLSVIGYQLSAISYRLSVIAYQLSPIQGEARLRGTRTPTMTLSPLAYFSTLLQDRTSTTTLSTCGVCGKMSTGVARSTV
jgi:hypothetical protein